MSKSRNNHQDCIFCKIASHKAPSKVDYEDDNVIAVRSINPVADIHILIMPKAHIETFMDIKPSDKYLNQMASAAQKLITKYKLEDGYKLAFNGGRYQEIPHLHWHLLGGNFKNKKDILNDT